MTRVDSRAKVTGSVQYGVDAELPGMLHGKVLRAGVAHGRILDIDVSQAEALAGVRAVITGADHGRLHGPLLKDQPPLARDKVRYAGEVVAAVAAETEEIAMAAIDLIRVEYEELPGVFDVDEALALEAPLVHDHHESYERVETPGMRLEGIPGTNIAYHFKLRRGDVEAAFATADLVVEDTFTTQFVQYCHLEPHVAVAQFDDLGMLTLWSSTMGPHTLRSMMADLLEIPLSNVRVILNMVGGAYGAKMYLRAINPVAALLARKCGTRPVRVAFERGEEFTISPGRLPVKVTIKTAARDDGMLLARKSEIYWNKGAYMDLGGIVARNAGYAGLGPYRVPNAWIDAYLVYTNRQPGGAFRGLGIPQMAWAGEQQLDRVAHELGISPLSLRQRNLLHDGDVSITGEVMRQVGAEACLSAVAEALDRTPLPAAAPGHRVGRGLAVVQKSTLTPTATFATVKMNFDGSVDVVTAAVEHGQGSLTALAQIAAEGLGVPVERVRCHLPDTSVAPFDRSSSSSRTIFAMGNAINSATADIREQLLDLAAALFARAPEDLLLSAGRVGVRDDLESSLTYQQIMDRSFKGPGNIVGRGSFITKGMYDSMDPDTGQSARPTSFWMYAASGAEVDVDLETGQLTVRRLITAVDAGKAINPQGCEQQIAGSAVMGLGMTMMEELQFDGGHVLNPSFLDYKVPTTVDVPELENIVVETYHADGPYGARGVGEPGVAPVPPAIGNALFAASGTQVRDLPLKAERVYRALQGREDR
ncbi:MAG: xanthine dehydrogenase family protein molybdopterin-binding subunit [Acidimicrobiales bacterium]